MIEHKDISIPRKGNDILADLYMGDNTHQKLIIFCHGFKGFKDWGAWHLVAKAFAQAGFTFLKFNFSYNGVGQDNLQDFTRLDLFFENNYSRELADIETVLNWVKDAKEIQGLDIQEKYIIGHSRGGGIALQAAARFSKIAKLATWASISHFDRFGDEQTKAAWKKEGSRSFFNSRTQQDMKIGVQFYEDYLINQANLNLEKAAKSLNTPYLIVHGKDDDAVGFSNAQRLKKWCPAAKLHLIDGANHVFGAKHPYAEEDLPKHLQEVVDNTLKFFTSV